MRKINKNYLKLSTFIIFAMPLLIIMLLATKTLFKTYNYYEDAKIQIKNSYYYYPKFNNKLDLNIKEYLDSIDPDQTDYIKYSINIVDSYVNILFKLYKNNAVIDYKSLIFNSQYKDVEIDELVTNKKLLTDKIKLITQNYKINFDDEFIEKATYSYYFKDNELLVYLSNYDEHKSTLMIDINYKEIKDILNLKKFKIDKNYNLITTTSTTSTVLTPDINYKYVAFTFDDGPSLFTVELMNALDAYNAKATFFQVGYMMRNKPDITMEVYNRGFEIANHTSDHSKLTKLNKTKILEKINSNNEFYNLITGDNLKLVRPPYGAYDDKVKSTLDNPIILWSVDSRDWESRNTIEIVNVVLSTIKDGDIVLFHDLYPTTVEAVKILLPKLYEENYKVVSVSELFAIKNMELVNHKVYRCAC